MGQITMEWTREKALSMLEGELDQKILEKMSDKGLHQLGRELGYWGDFLKDKSGEGDSE